MTSVEAMGSVKGMKVAGTLAVGGVGAQTAGKKSEMGEDEDETSNMNTR